MDKNNIEIHPDVTMLWELEQGTPEWHKVRSYSCGGTGAYSVLRKGFHPNALKVSKDDGGYIGWQAQWGHDKEPEARDLLAALLEKEGIQIVEAGAILNKKWPHCHGSPDGCLIKDNKLIGIVEIKSFQEKHHRQILEGGIEPEIEAQLSWNMWLSETELGYFVAYNPTMKKNSEKLYIEKHKLKDIYKKRFEEEVTKGLQELKDNPIL